MVNGMEVAKFGAASNSNVSTESEPVDIFVTASGSRSITDESEQVEYPTMPIPSVLTTSAVNFTPRRANNGRTATKRTTSKSIVERLVVDPKIFSRGL